MQALILLIVEFRVGLLNHVSKIAPRSACQDSGPSSLHPALAAGQFQFPHPALASCPFPH